jgi:adenylate cyclase
MSDKGLNRKLTAILSADVKGYSRLMGEDEDFTVATLTAYRKTMTALIDQHRGRVVDSPGDNLLAEFASAVNAVRCAVEIQTELEAKNAELPENRRMEFRIGINLGDVIEEGERIYGDGVNIASRVEGLAQAGGVCIARTVYDQVKNKLPLRYKYLGEHTVKNIAEPVQIYRILIAPKAGDKVVAKRKISARNWQKSTLAAIVVLLAGAVTFAVWHYRSGRPSKVTLEDKITTPLSAKPSIAVLPFTNLSGDAEQEYFSDGLTNDIITDLSKFRELFVIASNTVFTYKSKPVKIKDLAGELNVRYLLEGSVQKTGAKVRINAQLIDTASEHHLWAERYDRDLKDLFAVQDEIVQTIVSTLAVKIDAVERTRVMHKDTDSLEAYDYVLRGREYFSQTTRSANSKARQMFESAIELDPRYAMAYVGLSRYYMNNIDYGWTEFPARALKQAYNFAHNALSLDDSNDYAHTLLGEVYAYRRQYDLAISELQRAIQLNPNNAYSHGVLGTNLLWSGKPDEAIPALESALRFDPNIGATPYMLLGLAYYLTEPYDHAIRTLEKGLGRQPDFPGTYIALAAVYAQSGQSEEAMQAAATVRRLQPFFEVDSYGTIFRNPDDRAKIVDGLRKAGLK